MPRQTRCPDAQTNKMPSEMPRCPARCPDAQLDAQMPRKTRCPDAQTSNKMPRCPDVMPR